MPFNEMLDHQKSRCQSGKTNQIFTQHLNLKHRAMKKLSSLGCKKVIQDAIQ
jgi:hypothetical protein